MKSRGLRVVLVLLAVAALGGAGYFAYLGEVRAQTARATQRAFETDVARLQTTIAELRAALPGYVAVGQDAGYWAGKISQLLQNVQARSGSIERAGVSTEASQQIGTAEEALAMLRQQDGRIRDLLDQGQTVEASRLIFQDAAQLLNVTTIALSEAASLQASKTIADIERQRWEEIYGLGGAAGLAFLVLLLLVPRTGVTGHARPDETTASVAAPMATTSLGFEGLGRSGFDLDLKDFGRPRNPPPPPPVAPAPVPAPQAAASGPDLLAAARLCTDLARVTDTDQLQQMLGRAASLLDATGIVVWLGNTGGSALRPAFSFGYGAQTLARMQTLQRDDENAVSAAYRHGRVEVVPGAEGRNGALVTPMLSAGGCVGAMAVETKAGGEGRADLQAVAAIIAAQLATLMPAEEAGQA